MKLHFVLVDMVGAIVIERYTDSLVDINIAYLSVYLVNNIKLV